MHSASRWYPLLWKLCKALFWCKTLRKGLNKSGEIFDVFFQKVTFLANVRHCPNFLDYAIFFFFLAVNEDCVTFCNLTWFLDNGRLWHVKDKGMQHLRALSRNSEAIECEKLHVTHQVDVWSHAIVISSRTPQFFFLLQ